MSEHRDRLQEIAERGDPVEWLNILKHEATRANNAEGHVRALKELVADLISGLSVNPSDDPSERQEAEGLIRRARDLGVE